MKDKLTQIINQSPETYGSFYVDHVEEILGYVKKQPGLKSDIFIENVAKELDYLRFTAVFSDFTNIYLSGIGTGGDVTISLNQVVTINDEILKTVVSENQKPIIHAGYLMRRKEELAEILKLLKPLVEAGRGILHNSRIIVGLTNQATPDGKGRLWQSYDIKPDSPLGNWLTAENSLQTETIPIAFNPYDLDNKQQLFEISIPFLRGVPLRELIYVLNDYNELLAGFRKQIRNLIKEAKEKNMHMEEMKNDLILPEIGKIQNEFGKVSNIHKLKIAGTVIGTITLSLVSLSSAGIGTALGGLLGVGGLGLLIKDEADYQEKLKNLEQAPLYLLWKLKNQK